MKSAVFFERDGVINAYARGASSKEPPTTLEAFKLLGGIEALMASLKEAGLLIFVTTHQPGSVSYTHLTLPTKA